jgi:DNA repair protein RadC
MQEYKQNDNGFNSIKTWAEDDKPREKLLTKGPAALSDAELLTILISTGTVKRSALDLAKDTLALAGNNLQQLGRLTVAELRKTKGIGEAKAITIAAALELGRRRQMAEGIDRVAIKTSKHAAEIVVPLLCDLNNEVFCVLYLNQGCKLIKHEIVSTGGLNAVVADVRMILKNAILCNASRIILAHNHPSGDMKPSEADRRLTKKIKESAAVMDIVLIDHLIVANTQWVSMDEEGMI